MKPAELDESLATITWEEDIRTDGLDDQVYIWGFSHQSYKCSEFFSISDWTLALTGTGSVSCRAIERRNLHGRVQSRPVLTTTVQLWDRPQYWHVFILFVWEWPSGMSFQHSSLLPPSTYLVRASIRFRRLYSSTILLVLVYEVIWGHTYWCFCCCC